MAKKKAEPVITYTEILAIAGEHIRGTRSTSARRLSGWKEWRTPLSGKRLPWTLSA